MMHKFVNQTKMQQFIVHLLSWFRTKDVQSMQIKHTISHFILVYAIDKIMRHPVITRNY